jgi:hypothetical protein
LCFLFLFKIFCTCFHLCCCSHLCIKLFSFLLLLACKCSFLWVATPTYTCVRPFVIDPIYHCSHVVIPQSSLFHAHLCSSPIVVPLLLFLTHHCCSSLVVAPVVCTFNPPCYCCF